VHTILLLAATLTPGDAPAPVDFDNQIIPILTKAGCNSGACHGSAAGRGGLRLSLYGGNPEFDYESLVLELEGRRVNHARPESSLMLLKPTEMISHGGGTRLEYEGPGARLIERWISEGTPRLQNRHLEEFHVSPRSHVVERIGTTLPLKTTARFTDGTEVDATQWTVFTPEDPSAVEIDPETATAKLLRRGRHIVIARYLDRVVPLEMIVPLSDTPVDLSSAPRENFIDEHVLGLLATLRIPVSGQADDATFLRRATLDLTGRLATVEQTREFLSDPSPDKRVHLIDKLLASEEFTEYWTLQLAKLLRIRSNAQDSEGAWTYHNWLKQQIDEAVPYDQMAREVLLALGDTHEVGPANFYRTVAGPREQAEFASELFMGSRLRCANCHNHPLDRWTQDDYHGLAAIFAKVESGVVVKVSTRGEVTHPRTGEAAVPRIPGEQFLDSDSDGRQALARWLTDEDNPYFAKAIVNRLWKALMGRGLVEASDDFRDTNPPTHPALLEQLADDFIENGYDLRHTLRRIALSAAYARSSVALPENESDDRFYSHALTRPLEPEVLADAISDVLGLPDTYGDQPAGTRAVALFDSNISSESLDVLGRCSRQDTCESAGTAAGGLPQKLHMLNGQLINRRLTDAESRLAQRIADGKTPEEIVREFYLCALGRQPSADEQRFWNGQFAAADGAQQNVLEDFVWSLLNCQEFVTNH
jgi:hypothetical protein